MLRCNQQYNRSIPRLYPMTLLSNSSSPLWNYGTTDKTKREGTSNTKDLYNAKSIAVYSN